MVATGMSYKQIAARLVLSHRTVQNHVQNTLRKLQMNNRVQLTRWAIEHGLDDDQAMTGSLQGQLGDDAVLDRWSGQVDTPLASPLGSAARHQRLRRRPAARERQQARGADDPGLAARAGLVPTSIPAAASARPVTESLSTTAPVSR